MLFSAVAVYEARLHKSNSDLFNIPGYHFISNSREHTLGGSVGLYIQSDMSFQPRIDLQSSDNSLYESVFVEILRPHGKNIIVGCLYKPPDASLNDLGTFAPIATAHPYSARKFTCHVMHRARALSTKMNNDRADGHCYSFAWTQRSWMFGHPYFSFQKQILFTIISTLSKNEQKINVGSLKNFKISVLGNPANLQLQGA